MCYLVRQQQAQAERDGTTPQSHERLRPRLIGVVAATLIGGLALAALSIPPSTPSLVSAQKPAAPGPLDSTAPILPTAAAVVERVSMPMDDGVPSAPDTVRASLGHCQHEL